MTRKRIRKILFVSLSVFLVLLIVLVVHIYMVTKPKINEYTRVMARIDLNQDIVQTDADKISNWLLTQKGIDHVLVNPTSDIAVFTYAPIVANADKIVDDFNANLHYRAKRFIPTQQQLESGCPVATNSFSYKMYRYLKNIF